MLIARAFAKRGRKSSRTVLAASSHRFENLMKRSFADGPGEPVVKAESGSAAAPSQPIVKAENSTAAAHAVAAVEPSLTDRLLSVFNLKKLGHAFQTVELAKAVGLKTRKDVNSTLYRMQREGLIEKITDTPPRWGLPGAKNVEGSLSEMYKRGPPPPKDDLQNGENGDIFFELSHNRRVTVTNFKGSKCVDIREFYDSGGKLRPGKKGLMLKEAEWRRFCENVAAIDDAFKKN